MPAGPAPTSGRSRIHRRPCRIRRQCFVQAGPGQAGIAGQLAHVAGPRNIGQRHGQYCGVVAGFFLRRFQIGRDGFFAVQVFRRVEGGKFLAHGPIPPLGGDTLGRRNIPLLSTLVASARHHDQHRASPHEIRPVAGAIVDPKFRKPSPDGLHVADVVRFQSAHPQHDARTCGNVMQPDPVRHPPWLCRRQLAAARKSAPRFGFRLRQAPATGALQPQPQSRPAPRYRSKARPAPIHGHCAPAKFERTSVG